MASAIAERLAAAPPVAAARASLGERAGAWIVGGALRDAIRDEAIVDLDIAVDSGERDAARAIARAAGGHAFELSERFPTWRALAPEGWQVDVAAIRGGSIEADLEGRDFTINAIALSLTDAERADTALIDPHGGVADLEARRLRAVTERSFDDDPLRLLRAVRFAVAMGLELDPATAELARRSAAEAARPAGERQFAELRAIIAGPDPLAGVGLLEDLQLIAPVLPEVDALRGVVQNPNHHLDVLGHTLEVLAQWLLVETDLAAYVGEENVAAVEELLREPLGDGLTRRDGLRFAALTHDLGKPATRGSYGDYVTFIGHDRVGAEITRELCSRLRTSRRVSDYLAGIAEHHLRLGFLVAQRPLARRVVYEYLTATDPDPVDVTLLTVADRLSARGSGATASEEMISGHLELAREMIGEGLEWRRSGRPRSPIAGDELASELGIQPGPELGSLIAEIEAGVFAGEVSDRDSAIALARSRR
jgi:putative nucleotidyltransferase with HDIG domain